MPDRPPAAAALLLHAMDLTFPMRYLCQCCQCCRSVAFLCNQHHAFSCMVLGGGAETNRMAAPCMSQCCSFLCSLCILWQHEAPRMLPECKTLGGCVNDMRGCVRRPCMHVAVKCQRRVGLAVSAHDLLHGPLPLISGKKMASLTRRKCACVTITQQYAQCMSCQCETTNHIEPSARVTSHGNNHICHGASAPQAS